MNENLDPSSENLSSNEREFENNLRPVSFEDFSGQDHVINNLKICFDVADPFVVESGLQQKLCRIRQRHRKYMVRMLGNII